MSATAILVNGKTQDSVSVQDRGLQYGDGLFETIAVYKNKPLLWERHLDRLARGAHRLRFDVPTDILRDEAFRLCANQTRAVLKIVLTRGNSARGYAVDPSSPVTRILMRSDFPNYPISHADKGISLGLCGTTLGHNTAIAGLKHLNRLEQVLARMELATDHADGLMRDMDGKVIEGVMSNVFIVSGGALKTPSLTRCGVEGVMRSVVVEAARDLGLPCEVGTVTLEETVGAEELFLTNSLIGVWPVRHFQGKEYTIGPVTRIIQKAVHHEHCFDRS